MSFCLMDNEPTLYLRGLCKSTSLDLAYYPINIERCKSITDMVWVGVHGMVAMFNPLTKNWNLHQFGTQTSATINAEHFTFMLGKEFCLLLTFKLKDMEAYTSTLGLCYALESYLKLFPGFWAW